MDEVELTLARLRRINEKLDALGEEMHSMTLDIREIKTRLELIEPGHANTLRTLDRLIALAERDHAQMKSIEDRLNALERAP